MSGLGRFQRSFEIAILTAVVLLCSIAFANAPGTEDVGIWFDYMHVFDREGLLQGYAEINDNIPPLGASLLWLMSAIATRGGLPMGAVLHATLVILTLFSIQAFYAWTRSPLFCLGLLATVLFNVALGYLDTAVLPLLLWSLHDLRAGHSRRGAVLYCLASLIKWQPLIAAPFFFLRLVLPHWRIGLRDVMPAFLVGLLVVICFGITEPINAFQRAMEQDYISGQALNLMWLVTAGLQYAVTGGSSLQDGLVHWQKDFPSGVIGLGSKLLFISLYTALVWRYIRSDRRFATTLLFATAGSVTYFAFAFSVHENHVLVGCVLSLALGYLMPSMRFLSAVLIALNAMNLMLFYGLSGHGLGFNRSYGVDITIPFAIVVIAVALRYWAIAMFLPHSPLARAVEVTK